MDPVLAAIDDALARLGLTDAAASRLAVGNYSLIKNMRADRGIEKRYSFQSLQELARVLGLECYFGPKRAVTGFSEASAGSDLGRQEALRAGFLPIPWHDAAKRKGSAPIAFQSAWLASEAISPDYLRAIVPDVLQLSIASAKNSVAVLDTVAAQKGSSGLWCYTQGGIITVGRAAFTEKVVVLFPDDSQEGPVQVLQRPLNQGVAILGRAIWLGVLPKL